MKKVVGYVLAIGVLFGILLLPAFVLWLGNQATAASAATGDVPEPTTITSYDARFDLARDGDLAVTERLTVLFPAYTARHGIFRFWDRYDVSDPYVRRVVEDVGVTLDGRPVEFELSTRDLGRFDVAKIGSADVFVVPGEHTYVITYTVPGTIEGAVGGATSSFYWDLIPAGWARTSSGPGWWSTSRAGTGRRVRDRSRTPRRCRRRRRGTVLGGRGGH